MDRKRRNKDKDKETKNEIRKYWDKGLRPGQIMERLDIGNTRYYRLWHEIIEEDGEKKQKRFHVVDKIKLVKDKPFWIWDDDEHNELLDGRCCFNHIVGLPEKNGKPLPLFDYEKRILDELDTRINNAQSRHLWLKKATGLGISELFLRYMAWLCYRNDTYKGAQMCIVTGPNLNLAKGLIRRIKRICTAIDYGMPAKETAIVLNDCRIEAFPSHHLDSMRSLSSPKFILIDEADFFPPREQDNARDIAERYIAKSDPYIVMVSTPNMPGGLFDRIEKEPEKTCIYRRLKFDYTVGLGRIYTKEEIQKAQQSTSFEREYNLCYGYGTGKIFPHQLVDACIANYSLALQDGCERVLAIDPAYGTSKFAVVGVEKLDNMMYVKEAKQYERPSFIGMLEMVAAMSPYYKTVLVDSAYPGLIGDLMEKGVDASSVNFRTELPSMTTATVQAIYGQSIKIHPAFSDLLQQLRAVTFNEKGYPDKRKLSYDLGDALMMALHYLRKDNGLFLAKI